MTDAPALPATKAAPANDLPVNRRVRGVVVGPGGRSFLALVNNRVYPNMMTIMLPGGEPQPGEHPIKALGRYLHEQVGITAQLGTENTRFLLSRTYSYGTPQDQLDELVEVLFFRVVLDGPVPRNMEPDSVLSLTWMTLTEAERLVADGNNGWAIQAGAMDALEAVLDDAQTREGLDGAQEVARYQAPRDPRNARLPYGGPDSEQTGAMA